MNSRRILRLRALLLWSVLALNADLRESSAAAIVDWVVAQGSPATFNLNTNSPTIGDGTPENADAVIIHASFPRITLANTQAIVLSGAVTFAGITSTDGATNQQFRLGLFDRIDSPSTSGWLGYFLANSTSVNAGVLRRRNADNIDLFIGNNGSVISGSTANAPNSKTGAILTNETYMFSLQLTRDGNFYDVTASISGGPGGNFFDSFFLNNIAPAATETFSFDHVGFLLGTAMDVDQAVFSNVDVTHIPEPATWTLLAAGFGLGLRRSRGRDAGGR